MGILNIMYGVIFLYLFAIPVKKIEILFLVSVATKPIDPYDGVCDLLRYGPPDDCAYRMQSFVLRGMFDTMCTTKQQSQPTVAMSYLSDSCQTILRLRSAMAFLVPSGSVPHDYQIRLVFVGGTIWRGGCLPRNRICVCPDPNCLARSLGLIIPFLTCFQTQLNSIKNTIELN